jgi:uncharacterized protein YacL
MNLFIKEILISTIGVIIGIIVSMLCLTIILYLLEDLLLGKDRTVAGAFFVLYFLVIPFGAYFGNKYAVKWFVD